MTARAGLSRRAMLALAATTVAAGPDDSRPILRVAVPGLPPTLDPLDSVTSVSIRISDNLFDTLLRRDFAEEARTGTILIRPHLARSVEQIDALTWVATLRPGILLHDGAALNAADVAASFSQAWLFGPESPYYEGRTAWGHLESVTADGPDRVVFRTRLPDVVMRLRLATYPAFIGSRSAMAAGHGPWRAHPVGTGPYRVGQLKLDQRLVLESHDGYFEGRPAARQVIFSAVPEASSRLAGLRAGDFDIATNLLPDQLPELTGDPRLEALAVTMDIAQILVFDTRRPALRDRRVRQALVHAVDTALIGRTLWGEDRPRMTALQLPSFGALYLPDRAGLAYDPDRARRLLAEAGWQNQDIVLRTVAGYYDNMVSAMQIIQEMWRAVGVSSRLEVRENRGSLLQPGADARPMSVGFRFPDPLGGGLMVQLSRSYQVQQQGWWRPERFNAIADAFAAAVTREDRKNLWRALLDEFDAEAPALILYPVREITGKRRGVRLSQYRVPYLDLRPGNFGF